MMPAFDNHGSETPFRMDGQDPNSNEQLTNNERAQPPAPGSPEYTAWAHQTFLNILANDTEASPATLVARVTQFEGVIRLLLRENKTWKAIARLLEQKGVCADPDVLRVTYKRVCDKRGSRRSNRQGPVRPQTVSGPTPRSDLTNRQPTAPTDTPVNRSGRIR